MAKTNKMIIKILVDLENEQLGVIEVSANKDIGSLKKGTEFLALVFQQLADQYGKRAKELAVN